MSTNDEGEIQTPQRSPQLSNSYDKNKSASIDSTAAKGKLSLLSQNSTSPESSYKKSPNMDAKPLLFTSNVTPNKKHKYFHPPLNLSDKIQQHDTAYTLPLLNNDGLTVNNKKFKKQQVIHRSLLDGNAGTLQLQLEDDTSIVEPSIVSRRFSADDKNRQPIQTYVVLHQKSHNYQFFNEQSNMRSGTFWGDNEDSDSEYKDDKRRKKLGSARQIERLNFDKMENEIYHKEWKYDQFGRRGFYKWIICFLIGLLTGLLMYIITLAIQFILNIVILDYTRDMVQKNWYYGTGYYLGCNIICASIASLSVIYIEKAAAGSGIPEVKAYLNGSWIPHLFNIRTLFVKLFGVTFAVSGSFIIGKEGPMVHTGAIIANGVSRGRSRTIGFDCGIGYTFRNDNDARSFISCGAAAGVSAAFGAPVGGMLFALEEVSSFWQSSLTWRAFFCAAVSTFFLDVCLSCFDNNAYGECGVFTRIGLITFNDKGSDQKTLSEYTPLQLLGFIIIAIAGGLIGALFNSINIKLCAFRKRIFYKKRPKLYPILDVLFASLMTTLIIMVIPQFIYPECRSNSSITISNCAGDDRVCHDITNENQFNCESGNYNAISALLLGEREHIIKYLFHYDSHEFFSSTQVIICCIAYFIMAVYTYGLSIPSGLFIPLILIGSTFGWWFGYHWEHIVMNTINSTNVSKLNTYALMGASALLGGSTRMTISLTAIIMEITNDIYYLLPIMLVVMISKWVGDRFNSAIYESHVALSHIPYLEHSLPKWIPSYLCAKDIMTKKVQILPIICPLRILNRYLRDKNKLHNAFPIIDCEPHEKVTQDYLQNEGKYVGVMLRWHIMILLSKRNFAPLEQLQNLPLLTGNDLTDSEYKNKYIHSYQNLGISLHELNNCYIDFSPYMHLSPFTVTTYTPIYRVYTLFRGLGLRHLIVLDLNNKYVDGIITANNLNEVVLENAVHKFNQRMKRKNITNNDYICYRIQQMTQSKICKKYNINKRLTQSIDITKVLNNNNKVTEKIHEEEINEINIESTTDSQLRKSVSNFSIAKSEKDMKQTLVTNINDQSDNENSVQYHHSIDENENENENDNQTQIVNSKEQNC